MANLPTINLRVIKGPVLGQVFTINNQPKTIGRGAGSDFVIDQPGLDRLHARIKPTAHGYVIEALVNKNDIFVNDRQINRSAPLRPGSTVRLGTDVVFRVQLGGAAPAGLANSDVTWMPPTALAPGDNEQTMVPGGLADSDRTVADSSLSPRQMPAAEIGATVIPGAPGATVYVPPRDRTPIWLWGMGAVIALLIVVAGGLAYTRYGGAASTGAAAEEPSPTLAPTDTPAPTQTPAPTSTALVLNVPGVALASAPEQAAPRDMANLVDPFCNSQLEIEADEPVLVGWQQRLAQPDGELDYVAQWLASAHYDLSLDGRPLRSFNYEHSDSPSLTMWVNLGLLTPGSHYLRIAQYSSRPVSTGLDLAPADGQVDLIDAGPVAEGFCELIVPQPTAAPTSVSPTGTPPPTPTPAPTATPQPARPAAPQPAAAAPPGIFQDFERAGSWKRGDQPNGQFTRGSGQVRSGSYSGQLRYNFPTANNDYVVFLQQRALGGRPNAISAWVYGDGSSHFLNVWIKDAGGQTWQMNFGRVAHTGWQEMTAFIDPGQPWPSGHISGPDNGAIEYPISFQALVLDDGSDDYSGSGTIHIDDLTSKENVAPPTPTPAPTPTVAPLAARPPAVANPPPVAPPPAPPAAAPAGTSPYTLQLGGQHTYEEPWGAPRNGDPCHAWRNDDWDDRNGNFRGFNVEVILTNNSVFKVADSWPGGMSFVTSGGQTVPACYYDYVGAGPPPSGSTSVTFFTVVPVGQFVQVMQLSINGQFAQLCLDGRGGASYC